MSFNRKSDILTQWLTLPVCCSKCNFENLPLGCYWWNLHSETLTSSKFLIKQFLASKSPKFYFSTNQIQYNIIQLGAKMPKKLPIKGVGTLPDDYGEFLLMILFTVLKQFNYNSAFIFTVPFIILHTILLWFYHIPTLYNS